MYGIELKPGEVSWVEPAPELCLSLSNAVLVKSPKNPKGRVVLEICEHPSEAEEDDSDTDDDQSGAPLHVAVAVLTKENDSIPLSIFINSNMGLRLSGKGSSGAVVHVTGTKFTPVDDITYADGPMSLPEYMAMNPNGISFDDDDDDDDFVISDDIELDYDDDEDSSDDSDDDDDDDDNDSMEDSEDEAEEKDSLVMKIASADDEDDTEVEVMRAKQPKRKIELRQDKKQLKKEDSTKIPSKAEAKNESKKNKASLVSSDDAAAPAKKKAKRPASSMTKHQSGLQYQDLITGSGKRVERGRNVALQYTIRLENGKVVDKADRKRPFRFRLGIGECIKGFDIGVMGMREGGERHLIVPPELGYGDQKTGSIPSGSTLYFDVSIVKAF